jgi:hypothetical protein
VEMAKLAIKYFTKSFNFIAVFPGVLFFFIVDLNSRGGIKKTVGFDRKVAQDPTDTTDDT